MPILLVLVASGAGMWYYWRVLRDPPPVSFARLQESATAVRLGISNQIPAGLRQRARGLAQVVAWAEQAGWRVTSMYRAPEVTRAIYEERAGQSLAVGPTSVHAQARAFDTPPGARGERKTVSELSARKAAVMRHPKIGPLVTRAIAEGAEAEWGHVHVELDSAKLEALGTKANAA